MTTATDNVQGYPIGVCDDCKRTLPIVWCELCYECYRHIPCLGVAEIARCKAEIRDAQAALRDGSIPAESAHRWKTDWMDEQRILEGKL